MATATFSQKISIINSNPHVIPPDEVLGIIFKQAEKDTSPIPIKGKINGADFEQNLVRYKGDWRLYINIVMAKQANIRFKKSIAEIVGTVVKLEIEFNPLPFVYPMEPLLQHVLDKNYTAKKTWDVLIPSRQKEIIRYLSRLQSTEAKQRNLEKVMRVLLGEEMRFMGRSWKNGK